MSQSDGPRECAPHLIKSTDEGRMSCRIDWRVSNGGLCQTSVCVACACAWPKCLDPSTTVR
eukprot:5892877-Alexandrium_andersonii.AAC.1